MDTAQARNLIVDTVTALPTLPDVVHNLLRCIEDPNTSARDLGDCIAYDQAISSRLLKVANSAYYGRMSHVATVKQAIIVLGFDEVKSLALGIGVFTTLNASTGKSGFDRKAFWLHSITCALTARIISERHPGLDRCIAFTGGLLHDIGKIALDLVFHEQYRGVHASMSSDALSLHAAEQKIFGFSHAEAGGWLAERWKFPASLVEPIRCHHKPERAAPALAPLTAALHAADCICRLDHAAESYAAISPAVRAVLNLSEPMLAEVTGRLNKERASAQTLLNSLE
jgi:putative nucleotidyltransferase with HDIG domain